MRVFFRFLTSKDFLKQLLFVAAFISLVLVAVLLWLKSYTNHGQKLSMPDYTNMGLQVAMDDAENKSFSIVISDSLHIVGKTGGTILSQNPVPGSMVKEKRKIYVTTTKYSPDHIQVKDLPILYGTDYNQAVADLKSRSIFSEIRSKRYDAGQPDHILEVWYEGKLIISKTELRSTEKIEKGGTLQFIVSENQGGSFVLPNLVCRKLSDAKSYMLYSKMKLGKVSSSDNSIPDEELWIVSQSPTANEISTAEAGTVINVSVSREKPANCP